MPRPTITVVKPSTRNLWNLQNRHEGDRVRLYQAVQEVVAAARVLYPGSFVDVAASTVFPHVTYVEIDRRAKTFFDDSEGVREILSELGNADSSEFAFVNTDYRSLQLEDQSFDMLISLYAGFVSEHCTPLLRVGGTLLVNSSHGDAALASIDRRYELGAAVLSRGGEYSIRTHDLDEYMIPKRPVEITPEYLHERGRGIAYTRPAFAYLFNRVT